MADFLGLVKQATELKSKMEALQAELDQIEVEGAAGGGWAIGFLGDGCTVFGVGPAGVTLFDAWTGQKTTIRTTVQLYCGACANDGRAFIAGDATGNLHVWDVRELRKELRAKETKLTPQELCEHWAALADMDSEKAFRSIRALAAAKSQTVPALRERIKPAKAEGFDADAVAKWGIGVFAALHESASSPPIWR